MASSLEGDAASGDHGASPGDAVTTVMECRQRREHAGIPILARQRIAEVKHPRRRGGARQNENVAVVRVCQTILREVAQPLTGILAYSEMLVTDATYTSEAQRREVEGLREGALRLERLLHGLREALSVAAGADAGPCAADAVEEAMHRLISFHLSHREAS